MKILTNLAGSYLTSDAVADAVVGLHDALAALGAVDLIDVPVIDKGRARLAPIAVGSLTKISVRAASPPDAETGLAMAELDGLAQGWNPPPR